VATAIAAANIHEASEREAHHDALTSLPNRRQLSEDLRGPLLEAAMGARPMAIAMLDIDHFKRLNDEYGHKIGDVTLQRVSETLRACVRGQDRVYRYGGEEFLVVFADADLRLGGLLAERLRAAVERMQLISNGSEPASPVTISIGVAAFPDDGQHLEALIDTADQAMYASKQCGRNRVTLARDCSADGAEGERLAA
jgi:diguanylate cyclase (GGDEF)-like protein